MVSSRMVGLLCVAGGSMWLVGYGTLMSAPTAISIGHVPAAMFAMAIGALLLATAAGFLFASVVPRFRRILGVAALVISASLLVIALALLATIGDVEEAWGVVDQEWLAFWGLTALMAAMAHVTIGAARFGRSWISVAWAAAILGASVQAALYLAYALVSGRVAAELLPIPIVTFGLAWLAIGLAALLPLGRADRRVPAA